MSAREQPLQRWRRYKTVPAIALIGAVASWLSLASLPALGDAIVVTQAMTASTIAEIFIDVEGARLELEIGATDLAGFRNLMPDEVYKRMGFEPKPLVERYPFFFEQDFVFRADGGSPLQAYVVSMEPRPRVRRDLITGEPMPLAEGEEAETVIRAVLEYPFRSRPSTLSIKPPQRDGGVPVATIGFVAYHDALPINDFRYLGVEEIIDLDWEDPWYSKFRNRNLRRQYDSPISAFLYVEPYEVRTEIIVRPIDMEQWIDLGLKGRKTIPVEMQFELKQQIAEFLADHQNLLIDGQPVEPELDRVNFLRRTLRTSTVVDPPEELDLYSATLGVIYVAPTDGYPQEANITWDLFSEKIQRVPAAATDEAGPLRFFLVPDDNVLWWKNFLKSPTLPTLVEIAPPPGLVSRLLGWLGWVFVGLFVAMAVIQLRGAFKGRSIGRNLVPSLLALLAAVGCFAATMPNRMTDERSEEIVASLLHNIYRAFDFRSEENIYDVLEQSVAGELLTDIYLETRRGLELASQGGARAKVKEIEMLDVDPRPVARGQGFVARSTWNVSGSVGHWGHVHTRTNQYEADLTIEPIDGAWRVTNLEILQEERL